MFCLTDLEVSSTALGGTAGVASGEATGCQWQTLCRAMMVNQDAEREGAPIPACIANLLRKSVLSCLTL